MLRRLHDNVRDARVVHLLVQRGQVSLHELLHLRRGIAPQRSQLRELLLLWAARRRRKPVEIAKEILRLPRAWFCFPPERRTSIPQAFPLANDLFRHFIDLLLQLIGRFLNLFRNFGGVRLAGVGFPLPARRAKRLFHALDRSALLFGGFLRVPGAVHVLAPPPPPPPANPGAQALPGPPLPSALRPPPPSPPSLSFPISSLP